MGQRPNRAMPLLPPPSSPLAMLAGGRGRVFHRTGSKRADKFSLAGAVCRMRRGSLASVARPVACPAPTSLPESQRAEFLSLYYLARFSPLESRKVLPEAWNSANSRHSSQSRSTRWRSIRRFLRLSPDREPGPTSTARSDSVKKGPRWFGLFEHNPGGLSTRSFGFTISTCIILSEGSLRVCQYKALPFWRAISQNSP